MGMTSFTCDRLASSRHPQPATDDYALGKQNLAANKRLQGFEIGEIERIDSDGVMRKYRVILHHGQPLYLGGGHQIEMLVPVDDLSKTALGESLHDVLHRRIDEKSVDIILNDVKQSTLLSVTELDKVYQGDLRVLFGKLYGDGKIRYKEIEDL